MQALFSKIRIMYSMPGKSVRKDYKLRNGTGDERAGTERM
nr:MAG TPA: hypothetical protein [Caudoviricetes sp.]